MWATPDCCKVRYSALFFINLCCSFYFIFCHFNKKKKRKENEQSFLETLCSVYNLLWIISLVVLVVLFSTRLCSFQLFASYFNFHLLKALMPF